MTKHYILSINPQAKHNWDKCTLRNPLTGEHLDLTEAIAQAIGNQPGSYLIGVQIDVEILEKVNISSSSSNTLDLATSRQEIAKVKAQKRIAS